MPLNKETSLKTINKAIASISRSAIKLNESIHETGVMCIQHAKDFGDTMPAARLVDAMPKSHRRGLLINWFKEFSPVTVAKDTKTDNMKAHLAGKEGEREWLIEEAKANPFYAMPEANREPEVPTYDGLHNNVVSYLDRVNKQAEKIEDADERALIEAEIAAAKQAIAG